VKVNRQQRRDGRCNGAATRLRPLETEVNSPQDSESSFHAKQLYCQGGHLRSSEGTFLILYAGSYAACIATITSLPTATPALRLYAARSHLALGDVPSALKYAGGPSPAARAVRLLAQRPATAVEEAQTVLNSVGDGDGDFGIASAIVGTLLQLEGETAEALRVLTVGAKAEDQEW
jgi:hypothetical protein